MTRIDFYHLQRQTLDDVLPKLVEKAYEQKKNIKILIGNEERVDFINNLLWTYNDDKFLPHGTKKDGFSEMQPIFLSSDALNPNNALYLFVVDDADMNIHEIDAFERIFYIFDGNSEYSLNKARTVWKNIKNSSGELYYWQQDDNNKWHQK